jgi:hypothetical protein
MPSSWYSIGSSVVMIFVCSSLISLSALYNVVVLPEPVGPVTNTMPCGNLIKWWNWRKSPCPSPAAEREIHAVLVQDRITIPSPCNMGIIETRMSTSRPDSHLDPAVLRNPLLGDIQPSHDLQTADDGCLKAVDLRRSRLRLQTPSIR